MTRLIAAMLGTVGFLFGVWAYSLAQLPYNEEGRFFDVTEGVVYDTDAVVAYGFIAGVFLLLAVGVIILRSITKGKVEPRTHNLSEHQPQKTEHALGQRLLCNDVLHKKMKLPPLGKVFWFCSTNNGSAQDCVDWARDALCEGIDSPSLRILAGLEPLLNSFEVMDYTKRTLKELGIKELDGEEAVLSYSRDLAEKIIERRESLRANLRTLFRLCHENAYLSEIYDFYLLECAYSDFDYQDFQYYWEGATKENIEGIVLKTCQTFIDTYDQQAESFS